MQIKISKYHFFSTFFLLVHCGCIFGDTLSLIETQNKMALLEPLQKTHYSWKIESGILLDSGNEKLLYEYARITHALSVCGENVTEEIIDKCVYYCARINKTTPKIPCKIGINYSPWHRKFGKDLPPTDRGRTYFAELEMFSDKMSQIRTWIKKSNEKYQTNIKVGAILLDCERFHVREKDEVWNTAIKEALDAIYTIAKINFPDARIEWYGRGISRAFTKDGWLKSSYFTGKELGDSLSCSLYSLFEPEGTRETYRRTCNLADELGVTEVTPWVALASGHRRGMSKAQYWSRDYDYDLIYSYKFGAELNHPWYAEFYKRFAPYNRAKNIVFYPAPFYKKTPNWGKHFIAYVRGANRTSDLTDLGFIEPVEE